MSRFFWMFVCKNGGSECDIDSAQCIDTGRMTDAGKGQIDLSGCYIRISQEMHWSTELSKHCTA